MAFFIPFPKPYKNPEKVKEWVKACGRDDFTVNSVKEWTYICSKHFVGAQGPSDEYPNPIPPNLSQAEYENWLKKKTRKRRMPSLPTKTSGPPKKITTVTSTAAVKSKVGTQSSHLHANMVKNTCL